MGQGNSAEDIIRASDLQDVHIQDDIIKHARSIGEIATLSYDDFVQRLGELNQLAKKFLDKDGKHLVFAVKKGTDSTILWKATVRIGCVKVDPITSKVESYRLIGLPEFLHVFKSLHNLVLCMETTDRRKNRDQGSSDGSVHDDDQRKPLTASLLLRHVDELNISKTFEKNTECCICLERSPEAILPCAHSYCLPCIEQWNVNNKTCPICREKLETTDDTWVISEAPDTSEITAEISLALDDLSKMSPIHQVKA